MFNQRKHYLKQMFWTSLEKFFGENVIHDDEQREVSSQ